jgi:hypothetical protein
MSPFPFLPPGTKAPGQPARFTDNLTSQIPPHPTLSYRILSRPKSIPIYPLPLPLPLSPRPKNALAPASEAQATGVLIRKKHHPRRAYQHEHHVNVCAAATVSTPQSTSSPPSSSVLAGSRTGSRTTGRRQWLSWGAVRSGMVQVLMSCLEAILTSCVVLC